MTFTSVPVRPETLARLKSYKVGGASYDELLNDLMDDHPTDEFLKEHMRRLLEEPRTPWRAVRAKLKE